MYGEEIQKNWKHDIPKDKKVKDWRINLNYRNHTINLQ